MPNAVGKQRAWPYHGVDLTSCLSLALQRVTVEPQLLQDDLNGRHGYSNLSLMGITINASGPCYGGTEIDRLVYLFRGFV